MELQLTRSKATKTKMLGGSDTYYVLHIKATIPDGEAALLKRYDEEQGFDLGDDVTALIAEKKLEGSSYPRIEELKRGIEYRCKFVAKVFSEIPGEIIGNYQRRLGRIRACETWEGQDRLSSDQPNEA